MKCCSLVSSLIGTELIFFRAACMVLRFMSVTITALITHQCFSYCWPVSPSAHAASKQGVATRPAGGMAETADLV